MARMPYLHSLDLDDHCQTYFGGLDDFVTACAPVVPRSAEYTGSVHDRLPRYVISTSAYRRVARS